MMEFDTFGDAARANIETSIQMLKLIPVAGMHQQFSAGFAVNYDASATAAIQNSVAHNKMLSQSELTKVASNIIAPKVDTAGVDDAAAFIPTADTVSNVGMGIGGTWAVPRYAFLMIIEWKDVNIGTGGTKLFTGFTDRIENSLHGSIDPSTHLIVNNIVDLRNHVANVMGGRNGSAVSIEDYNQVLNDKSALHGVYSNSVNELPGSANPFTVGSDQRAMRPQDILTTLGHSMEVNNEETYGTESSSIAHKSELSKRNNSSAVNFLNKSIGSVLRVMSDSEDNSGGLFSNFTNNPYNIATANCVESSIMNDPVLTDLHGRSPSGNNILRGMIKLSELEGVYNGLMSSHLVEVLPVDINDAVLNESSPWHGRDNTTMAAKIIANEVPMHMLNSLTTSVNFTATNGLSPQEPFAVTVNNITSNISAASKVQLAEQLRAMLMATLLPQIGVNGQSFRIEVDSSLYSLTRISVKLGDRQPVIFVSPTFADNLIAPTIADSQAELSVQSSSIRELADSALEVADLGKIDSSSTFIDNYL